MTGSRRAQRGAMVVALLLTSLSVVARSPDAQATECGADFGPHLVDLRAAVGEAMGQPQSCEQANTTADGTLQTTTTGTAFYALDTHAAIFTDGFKRWRLDSSGLTYWSTPSAVPLLLDGLPEGPAIWKTAVRCPVLYTHEVASVSSFRGFLTGLLQAGLQPVSFAVVDASMRGQGDLPPGCVVLSFDDALESQLRNAVPVLAELGVTALFFVMPAYQDGHHQYLGAGGIRALHDAGHIVGAHTCNHPNLTLLAGAPMMAELADCRHLVEAIVGVPVRYLAYPNGAVNGVVLEATAQAGYRAAFTTRPAGTLAPEQPLLLPRIRYDVGEGAGAVIARIQTAR